MFPDENLTCSDCGTGFVFGTAEHEQYAARGLRTQPVNCPECRAKASAVSGPVADRPRYTIVCSECGHDAELPFQPRGDKPAYCAECYERVRATG